MPLRILVKSGRVSAPATSTEEPDVVIDTEPGVMRALLAGAQTLDEAIGTGSLRVEGDRVDAARFVEMFRFPSAEDATAQSLGRVDPQGD